jgi:hypothetical protein
MQTLGDLGSVAKCSRSSQKLMFKPAPLTCMKVLDTFNEIAKAKKLLPAFFFFLNLVGFCMLELVPFSLKSHIEAEEEVFLCYDTQSHHRKLETRVRIKSVLE